MVSSLSCSTSLTEPQRVETENSSSQVNGRTSPPDAFIDVASDSPLPEEIRKQEGVITVVCNGLETARDLSITHSFSNSDDGLLEHNGLCTLPCASQPRRTGSTSVELEEDIKDYTKLENQTEFEEPFNPNVSMLSSTVVTVLAPQWSGRLRRTKRFEGTGNLEAHGGLQDVTNTEANRAHERFQETQNQHGEEGMFTDGSHTQLRVPFLGTRRNTVGWSTKSGPASLDYESKRKVIQSVSLDVNSGRMNNRRTDAGALSPIATTASPVSPLSRHSNEQKMNLQTGHQGGLSSLSSKPTTSSLLLSLRRFNSNSRNSPTPTLSEINPSPLSSSPNDRGGKLFTTHLSQTFLNNNEQERLKPLHSTSSISYRTTETGPIFSPSSSNYRERDTSKTCFFSSSTINKVTEDTPFTQQLQPMNKTGSSLSCSKQAFLSRGPSETQQNWRGSDKSTNIFSEGSVSSPRHSQYDSSALLKTHSIPRRTTLTSTSWWKQVTLEDSSPLTNTKNTLLVPPCNDNSDFTSPSPTDNKRFSCQIPNNRDNNNTTESVCKGNMNLVMKTQGGTHNLKQRNTEDSLDHKSDRLVKQQYGSILNNREPQKPHSLPDVLSTSKISRAPAQTPLTHSKDLSKHDVSNSSFTANVTELPPALLNPKSSSTPTESSSIYKNNHCPPKINNPVSPHNRDSQKFTKQSLSLETTNTLNSQAITSKFGYGLPPTQNTRTSPSFQSHPVCSQTNMLNASSCTGSSSQMPKFKTTATTTPLGFERSHISIPKPIYPKTVSSLSPTVNTLSKTNYSLVSTSSHPQATTAPSPSPLTLPITPVISSLLTPPPTPIITSPIYSETSSPNEGRTLSNSIERDPKKMCHRAEGKRVRRVTWEDSVDLKHSESISVEKPDPSRVPTSSLSPRSIRAPSIFSSLRSSSATTNTSHLCSPTPKTSNIEVGRGGKYRSLSSDSDLASRERERNKQRPSDTMIFDQGRRESTAPRQERTLSVESGTAQCRSSAPLSLPPDFSSGYMLRYSSPPYSTLMSTRSTQGETKNTTPRSPLFQTPSQPNYTPHLFLRTDPLADVTIPLSELTPSPINSPQPLHFQNKIASQESSMTGVSQTDHVNNNHCKNISQDHQNGQILLVDNRVHISSKSLQGDKQHNSSSTCVTETLVYSIKSKVDTAAPKNTRPAPLQITTNTAVSVETKLNQQSHAAQSKGAAGEPRSHSNQSSSGSSSTESQSLDDERCNRRMKESVMGKSRFFSVESNNDQSPKRSRFVLKKSVSTPSSSLSRSDSDRANKTNKKMDQVLNKLRQTFSTKRSDDDVSFPWKWKRTSQTPPVSGLRDISNNNKTLEEREPEREVVLQNNEKGTEENRRTQNRYTLIPFLTVGNIKDEFSICSDKSTPETDQEDQNACAEHMSESKTLTHLTIHSPTTHPFDLNTDDSADYKQQTTNQFLSCMDPSPNASGGHPAQFRKSTSSSRSPFSPFASLSPLSPLSPFPSPDVTDDSVFYSPKLQRRRESSSPCEPGEGISLVGSRRSRASTGPPSAGPGPDKERLSSSYADLKYGIEPGRSFSVSSVLSSRPSGPGRISTGSRFMSVGDLSESALACGGTGKDLDHGFFTPDWTREYDCRPTSDCRMSYFSSDPGKMRSRSLPRSLTRCLANWSSEASTSSPVTATTSTLGRLRSPNMNTCHFAWDTEGPPTPPPTPPLSPVSRRISKPPSLSSPTLPLPSSPGAQDSQSSRGHLPSRGYVSSLSTFEESSDSSSDTTTDDEYYLETGDEEKETEL